MAFAPAAFTLSAPADMATGVTTTPMLSWTGSLYAGDYRVQIDDGPVIRLTSDTRRRYGSGATVRLHLPTDRCKIIAEE